MKTILTVLAVTCCLSATTEAQQPKPTDFFPYRAGDSAWFGGSTKYLLAFTKDSTGASAERFIFYNYYSPGDTTTGTFMVDTNDNVYLMNGVAFYHYFKLRATVGEWWLTDLADSTDRMRFVRSTDTTILGVATVARVFEEYEVDSTGKDTPPYQNVILAAGFGIAWNRYGRSNVKTDILQSIVIGGKRYGSVSGVGYPRSTRGGMRVYPNPSTGGISVRSAAGTTIRTAELYDALGRIVYRISDANTDEIRFDAVGAPSGLYRVIVQYKDGKTESAIVSLSK